MADKKKFPMKKAEFMDAAKPQVIKIGDTGFVTASPKEFSSGSVGFYGVGKITLEVNGVPHEYQVGCNITAIGSKEAE